MRRANHGLDQTSSLQVWKILDQTSSLQVWKILDQTSSLQVWKILDQTQSLQVGIEHPGRYQTPSLQFWVV